MSLLLDREISDEDINENHSFSCNEYVVRPTVVGVVTNANNELGLVTNSVHNLFTLPGGGVEEGEEDSQAFVREMQEELSSDVEDVKLIGGLCEWRARDCKQYKTKVFQASHVRDHKPDTRTENEQKLGLKPLWFKIEDAKQVMKDQMERVKEGKIDYYNTSFNIYRDTLILEAYARLIL